MEKLSARGFIELYKTPTNQGFVAACNLGMRLHRDRDVVLLNSDTEVHNDWLDRLRGAALRTRQVATVTPLSNNAEICSYPRSCKNNQRTLEIGDAELDAMAAGVNAGKTLKSRPASDFACMRAALASMKSGYSTLKNSVPAMARKMIFAAARSAPDGAIFSPQISSFAIMGGLFWRQQTRAHGQGDRNRRGASSRLYGGGR